jgi:hypothetical protein
VREAYKRDQLVAPNTEKENKQTKEASPQDNWQKHHQDDQQNRRQNAGQYSQDGLRKFAYPRQPFVGLAQGVDIRDNANETNYPEVRLDGKGKEMERRAYQGLPKI